MGQVQGTIERVKTKKIHRIKQLREMGKEKSKLDSHVPENFCQIKIFPSLVKKKIICLFGV